MGTWKERLFWMHHWWRSWKCTCRLAPAESLASWRMGGRVSSHINSDGEEDGDIDVVEYDCGADDDHDHNGCLWVSIWWEWPHLLSIHDHPSHHQPCSFCTKRTQNCESKGPTSTMADHLFVWDVSEWVVPGAHLLAKVLIVCTQITSYNWRSEVD